MADNDITITIGGSASKLLAEAEKVDRAFKKMRDEELAATKTGELAVQKQIDAYNRNTAAIERSGKALKEYNARSAALSGVDKSAEKSAGVFGKLKGSIVSLAAPLVALSTLKSAIDFGAGIQDQADRLQMNAEAMQVIGQVGIEAGNSIEQTERALTRLRRASAEAVKGNEELKNAFKTLSLSEQELIGLPLETQLEKVAKAYAATGKTAQAYNAVTKIFGEEAGPRMQGVLEKIANEGMGNLTNQMKEAGRVMQQSVIDRLGEAGDAIDKLTSQVKIMFGTAIANLNIMVKNAPWNWGEAFAEQEFESWKKNQDRILQQRKAARLAQEQAEKAAYEKAMKEEREAAERIANEKAEKEEKVFGKMLEEQVKARAEAREKARKEREKAAKEQEKLQKDLSEKIKKYENSIISETNKLRDMELKKQKESADLEAKKAKEMRDQLSAQEALVKKAAGASNTGTDAGDVGRAKRIEDLRARADDAEAKGNIGRAARLRATAQEREEEFYNRRRERALEAYRNERDPERRAQMREMIKNEGLDKPYQSLRGVQEKEDKAKKNEEVFTRKEAEQFMKDFAEQKDAIVSLKDALEKTMEDLQNARTPDAASGGVKRTQGSKGPSND